MTAYHVLRVNEGESIELVAKGVPAHTANAAIRAYAENAKGAAGTYVAVPSRSWKPTTVQVETQTVIRLGGEKA